MESSIGVFDSGLGGVSVLREAIRVLPHENLYIMETTAMLPMGIVQKRKSPSLRCAVRIPLRIKASKQFLLPAIRQRQLASNGSATSLMFP